MRKNKVKSIENILNPFQRFFQKEASGGIVLFIFTAISLLWVNSNWGYLYHELWETKITISIGNFILSKTIMHWVNDGLMVIFFFVIGLEIKREIVAGELSSIKQASLPIFAAIGGMLLPALIFVFLNKETATSSGWGIPMATDIAFSLGLLSLLGKRVPLSLKIFLVAFAIVDDLGAVAIIAFFYSSAIHIKFLLIGLGLCLYLILFNIIKLRIIPFYMIIGWIIWYMFLKSGVHPTIAGVLIAFSIPIGRKQRVGTFRLRVEKNLEKFHNDDILLTNNQLASVDNIEAEIEKVQSPLQSLEHKLHGFVTYVVMPLFALINAGVAITISNSRELFNPLTLNIEVSLILGKVTGILLFSWLAVKTGIAKLPKQVKWIHLLGIGFLGGMGFTMSIFIAGLAFETPEYLTNSKLGIIVGSFISGIIGIMILKTSLKKQENDPSYSNENEN